MSGSFIVVIGIVLVLVSIWIWLNVMLIRKSGAAEARRLQAQSTVNASTDQTSSNSEHTLVHVSQEVEAAEKQSELEVVAAAQVKAANTPFARKATPFQLNTTMVPAFHQKQWQRCFYSLTEDPHVLGWIAFENDVIGASDRVYDTNFSDVLRNYRKSVEKLRREMGLSYVHQTSIVGEEGSVWFLTAIDDMWLALFVDCEVDIKELSDRLLTPLRQIET